ncbi:MAG: dUTP diphosphatase [Clostridiales Family XIII bacterium]|jgi:dUTP pyrophosphatase|nr:dUTP diphosphatase [Clostridiales Family XIII bacterium]
MDNCAIKVKIRAERGALLPSYETEGSAGMDLRARIDEPIVLGPMERALVPTGLFIELPPGYEAQVRSRSGLSVRSGIACVNGVGTVDSDYRGELMVPIVNLSDEVFEIGDGDRVAQMIVARYERVEWERADCLGRTERGAGGFGHTGVK